MVLGELAGVLLADPGAAVAADVVVGPQRALPVPQHDDALLADRLGELVARIGEPVLPPHAEPALGENCSSSSAENLRATYSIPRGRVRAPSIEIWVVLRNGPRAYARLLWVCLKYGARRSGMEDQVDRDYITSVIHTVDAG